MYCPEINFLKSQNIFEGKEPNKKWKDDARKEKDARYQRRK